MSFVSKLSRNARTCVKNSSCDDGIRSQTINRSRGRSHVMKSLGHKPLTQLLSIAESYDLKIEKGVWIGNRGELPGVEDYTMCFWLRLVEDWISLPRSQGLDTVARVILASMRNVDGDDFNVAYTLMGPTHPSDPITMRFDWNAQKTWEMYVCIIHPCQIIILIL